jgi:diguanylate cyclase (GGDEF)-like protein
MPEVLLLLQRLSVTFQLAVVVLLTIFFGILARSVRLQEVRFWTVAWLSNAVALGAVLTFTFFDPESITARLMLIAYLSGKTGYVILLVSGARHHVHPGLETRVHPRYLFLFFLAWGGVLGIGVPGIQLATIAQNFLVTVVLTIGGVTVFRHPRSRVSRWIGVAMLVESALFFHDVIVLLPVLWGGEMLFQYVRYLSIVDGLAELLVALSCLVAVADRNAEQLRRTNLELEESHQRLSRLVDLDPLTGLANRRSLRRTLEQAREKGASIIFLDIDDFKEINDRYGHQVGDTTLKRMARVLSESFRPEDRIFRWGGDEFLVVAPKLDQSAARQRISKVRLALSVAEEGAPRCSFSVGISELEAGADPTVVLEKADRLMYDEKRRNSQSGSMKAI